VFPPKKASATHLSLRRRAEKIASPLTVEMGTVVPVENGVLIVRTRTSGVLFRKLATGLFIDQSGATFDALDNAGRDRLDCDVGGHKVKLQQRLARKWWRLH